MDIDGSSPLRSHMVSQWICCTKDELAKVAQEKAPWRTKRQTSGNFSETMVDEFLNSIFSLE